MTDFKIRMDPSKLDIGLLELGLDDDAEVLLRTAADHVIVSASQYHNDFRLESSPDGSFIRCLICKKCMPLL